MIDSIDKFLRVRTPATEVMAVESPWLRVLIYGTTPPNARSKARPFRDDVAYGSVAGDNSRYLNFGPLHGLSLPGVTAFFQQPPRFAFIGLEYRGGTGGIFAPMLGGPGDYTDGLVPVWSALIPGSAPGSSLLVHASHGSYYTDREALKYVSRWLNNALLPTGKTLCSQWDTPLVSAGGRRRWSFQPDRLAPVPESELYVCTNGIGRLASDALHASRSIRLSEGDAGSVMVRWEGPAGAHLDRVVLFERPQAAKGVKPERPKRIATVKAAGETLHPTVVLPPLREGHSYYILAEAVVDNRPDPPIRLHSGLISIHAGQHFPPDARPPISKPPAPIR